jgi:hypothetical protein
MRHWILTLGFVAATRVISAQEALDRSSIVSVPNPTTVLGSAWIDLRQTAKAGSTQSTPDWIESVALIPPDPSSGPGRSVFRIRLAKSSDAQTVLFFRLFFNDKPSLQPEVVAWDESGSELLRSGPLGGGIDLDSSESVMIPMRGITAIDVEVPGDGATVRGAYLEWMTSSELVHPVNAGAQDSVPQPFSLTTPLHAPAQDQEQFGTVTATLSADPVRIGSTIDQAAVFQFGMQSQPLVALITFEIAGPRIDSPPELLVNGVNAGAVSLTLPELADPAYRGEMHTFVNEMQFQYTGWIRAQKLVPLSSLQVGLNSIAIVNGSNATAAVIRSTQVQLKYLWDKSDYILKPER